MSKIIGHAVPTDETVGVVGDIYTNSVTGVEYKCVAIREIVTDEIQRYYVWVRVGGGSNSGGGNSGSGSHSGPCSWNDITDKPEIPEAFSGSYNDLTDKPEIPEAFSGSYNDLTDKPDLNAPKNEMILNSSSEGSTKKFKITIEDSGVLTATEIEEG